jgi:hypothetical protein
LKVVIHPLPPDLSAAREPVSHWISLTLNKEKGGKQWLSAEEGSLRQMNFYLAAYPAKSFTLPESALSGLYNNQTARLQKSKAD